MAHKSQVLALERGVQNRPPHNVGKEPMCTVCTVSGHQNLPFHWLDDWNGLYFDCHNLSDYGYELLLGHSGKSMPEHRLSGQGKPAW